jgi:uncharacterized protein YbjT (DUF2867 family)
MILVTGATGNAGGALVRALSEAGRPVRALVRRPGSIDLLGQDAEEVVGDLTEPETFADALPGVEGLFLLSGYAGTDRLLAAARDAGVGHVVLLSSSALDGTDAGNAIASYHGATEDLVRRSGLGWSFLRPTSFMSNTFRWNDQLSAGNVIRAQFPGVPIATIDPRDIADVAIAGFDSEANEIYRITGPVALTAPERVEILGKALGRPLECYEMTLDETRADLAATMPAPYAEAIESFFARGTTDETTVYPTVENVTGHPARTFEQWCADNADLFPAP